MTDPQEDDPSLSSADKAAQRSEDAGIADETASYANAIQRETGDVPDSDDGRIAPEVTGMPMSNDTGDKHHPLPADDRARHDAIPESIEDVRAKGDDSVKPAPGQPPAPRTYVNPDGSAYKG